MGTPKVNEFPGNSLDTSTPRRCLPADSGGYNLDSSSVSTSRGLKKWPKATTVGALVTIAAGTGAVLALNGSANRKRLASGGGKLAGVMFPLLLSKALDGLCEIISLRVFTTSKSSRPHPEARPGPAEDTAAYIQRGEAIYARWDGLAEPRKALHDGG